MAERASSILAADFGSSHTRVLLFDVVDGEYRLVAQEMGNTTLGYPVNDVGAGLGLIVKNIEDFTGRKLLDKQGKVISPEDSNRNGVDLFIATASAGRPIRAVLIGLMPEISILTSLRAISGSYIEPVARLHLRDGLSEEERLNAILLGRPDMLFIAGGTEKGAKTGLLEILRVVKLALRITDAALRPIIIYAGNSAIKDEIKALFEDLTTVLIAENIRPTMLDEDFDSVLLQLGKAYDNHREAHGAGFAKVGDMSALGVLPSAQSYSLIAEYYASVEKANVMAVDIGSTASLMVGVFNGRASTNINTFRGLGQSADTLLQEVGEETIKAWLPFYPQADEIRNYALNKAMRPNTVPMSTRSLYLEYAFLRAGLQDMLNDARKLWVDDIGDAGMLPPVKVLLAGGAALTNSGHPALNLMLIADCMQPTGITDVKADTNGIIPALGALARVNPEAVIQLLESNAIEHLGTLVSIDGQPKLDEVVAKLEIISEGEDPIKAELKGGHVIVVPAPRDFTLKIKLKMKGSYRVGGKRSINVELHGGTAGIVFDARGRLLIPPKTVEERAQRFALWMNEVTDIQHDIPADWLIKPVEPVIEEPSLDDLRVPVANEKKQRSKPEKVVKEKKATPAKAAKKGKAKSQSDDFFADLDDEPAAKSKAEEEGSLRDLLG